MLTVAQAIGPKTVIITATPSRLRQDFCNSSMFTSSVSHKYLKRPSSISPSSSSIRSSLMSPPTCSSSSSGEDFVEDIGDFDFIDSFMPPPRKRERLTHLTPEEKNFRRKMKNRIAAQTARDRKKSFMNDLEDRIKRLQAENEALKHENGKLLKNAQGLCEENSRLKTESIDIHQKNVVPVVSTGSSSLLAATKRVKLEMMNESNNNHVTKSAGDQKSAEIALSNSGNASVAFESAEFINDLQQKGQTTAAPPQSDTTTKPILDVLLLIILAATINNCSNISANSSKTSSNNAIRLKLNKETEPKNGPIESNSKEPLSSQKLNALRQLYKAMRWKTTVV